MLSPKLRQLPSIKQRIIHYSRWFTSMSPPNWRTPLFNTVYPLDEHSDVAISVTIYSKPKVWRICVHKYVSNKMIHHFFQQTQDTGCAQLNLREIVKFPLLTQIMAWKFYIPRVAWFLYGWNSTFVQDTHSLAQSNHSLRIKNAIISTYTGYGSSKQWANVRINVTGKTT